MTGLYHRPSWRGRTNVDVLTIAALEHAEQLAGHRFVVTQGSYNTSVGASAGTHAGGGALDLRWTGDRGDIRALRRAGFAAWHRTPAQGPWPHHVHAVLIGHPRLSAAAWRQTVAYRAGRNGLASNAPDDGPRLANQPTWRDYMIIITDDRDRDDLAQRIAFAVWSDRDRVSGLRRSKLLRRAGNRVLNAVRRNRKVIRNQ